MWTLTLLAIAFGFVIIVVLIGLQLYQLGLDRSYRRYRRLTANFEAARKERALKAMKETLEAEAAASARRKASADAKAARRKENKKAKQAAKAAAEGRKALAEAQELAQRQAAEAKKAARRAAAASSAATLDSVADESIAAGAVVVNQLTVGPAILGHGSCGTLVFEGTLAGRQVAVKRMLGQFYEAAKGEIETLILSDEHPNVVRCYAMETDADFVYLALERCPMTLADRIDLATGKNAPQGRQRHGGGDERRGGARGHAEASSTATSSAAAAEHAAAVEGLLARPMYESVGATGADAASGVGSPSGLSKRRGKGGARGAAGGAAKREHARVPTEATMVLVRDIVSGLEHLHSKRVIHRDLKPHNVLVSATGRAKLSDMGIARRLQVDASSFDATTAAQAAGTQGWRAPELLSEAPAHGARLTRAVDVFSLGCVIYYVLTGGGHPFGSRLSRDANIVGGKLDLSALAHMPEAVHLLKQLLAADPRMRPPAASVLRHPLLWSAPEQLAFLCAVSDHIDGLKAGSPEQARLERALERAAAPALAHAEGGWAGAVDAGLLADAERWRRYNHGSARDLLRFVRNRVHHFDELAPELQRALGGSPGEGVLRYFKARFPTLVLDVYAYAVGEAMETGCARYHEWIGPADEFGG